jgi:hypothetical protein
MSEEYIVKLTEVKNNNKNKLDNLINKLEQCEKLEMTLNNKIKYAFKINDKLNNIQNLAEDLFFDVCKNINIKA